MQNFPLLAEVREVDISGPQLSQQDVLGGEAACDSTQDTSHHLTSFSSLLIYNKEAKCTHVKGVYNGVDDHKKCDVHDCKNVGITFCLAIQPNFHYHTFFHNQHTSLPMNDIMG